MNTQKELMVPIKRHSSTVYHNIKLFYIERLIAANIDPQKLLKQLIIGVPVTFSIISVSSGTIMGLAIILLIAILINSWISTRISQNKSKFTEQFEQAVTYIICNLYAGLNLVQAIEQTIPEVQDPMRSQLQQVIDRYRIGISLSDSLKQLDRSLQNDDYEYFCHAIEINRSSGGDLIEVLSKMEILMRQRKMQKGDMRSKTSEVRLTANLLIFIPIILCIYFRLFHPDMLMPLLNTDLGRSALTISFVLWGLGVFAIKRLANIHTIT
jgi:tight adherence protein B